MLSTLIPQSLGEIESKDEEKEKLLCPSAQSDWEGAKVFGVVMGTATEPRVAYLAVERSMSQEIFDLTSPVDPAEVLRIAAPCATNKCQHFEKGHCQLVSRTITHLESVVEKLPVCLIRPSCRWWNEHGREACFRCPQVVTNSFTDQENIILAATPNLKQ